jgi:hypothetical protein
VGDCCEELLLITTVCGKIRSIRSNRFCIPSNTTQRALQITAATRFLSYVPLAIQCALQPSGNSSDLTAVIWSHVQDALIFSHSDAIQPAQSFRLIQEGSSAKAV